MSRFIVIKMRSLLRQETFFSISYDAFIISLARITLTGIVLCHVLLLSIENKNVLFKNEIKFWGTVLWPW